MVSLDKAVRERMGEKEVRLSVCVSNVRYQYM